MNSGEVVLVEEVLAGSELTADAALGAGTITVEDTTDFQPDGGELLIGTEEKAYSVVNETTGVITLDTTLAAAYLAADRVIALPQSTERFAHVQLEEQDETLQARIPHSLFDRLPVGIRDENTDEAELVELARSPGGELVVSDVLEREPVVDGSYVDPTTLPPPATSDGSPPGVSPTPILLGGLRSLFVSWVPIANADPVTYEVHLGTASGFTPSAGTFVGEEDGTLAQISVLPGTTTPLVPGTTYYVKLIAKDEDGAAAAGTEASGTPGQVTGPDIAAENVAALHLIADDALFAKLQALLIITNTLKTAEEGQRVEVDTDGIRLMTSAGETLVDIPTDPAKSPTFRGDVITGGLTVLGNALIQGDDNLLDKGAVLTLSAIQSPPTTAPVLAHDWNFINPIPSVAVTNWAGLFYDPNGFGTQATYLRCESRSGSWYLVEYKAADMTELRSQVLYADDTNHVMRGVARKGTDNRIWIMYWGLTDGKDRLIRLKQTDLTSDGADVLVTVTNPEQLNRHGLGTDGTDLIFVDRDVAGATSKVRLNRLNATTGALISQHVTNFVSGNNADVRMGVVSQGGFLWIATKSATLGYSVVVPVDPAAAYAESANKRFRVANAVDTPGLTYNGTNFVGLSFLGSMPVYDNWTWTTESQLYWLRYTWRDIAGGFETTGSPAGSLDMTNYRRSRILISLPTFPAGVNGFHIYTGRNATIPALSAMLRQTAAGGFITSETSRPTREKDFDAAGAALSGVTNNFPGGTSELRSEVEILDGGWSLRGNAGADGLASIGRMLRRGVWGYTDLTEGPVGQVSDGWNSGGFKFVAAAGSTGAGLDRFAGQASHPGIARVLTGTVATGDARLQFDDFMDAGTLRFSAWILLQALSTAAQRFTAVAGIGQAGANSVQVAYKDDVAGGAWQLNLLSGTTDPLDDNGGAVVVAASTWYLIEVLIVAGVLSVWINKTLKASGLTTNVPTTGEIFPGVRILKSVGTLSRAVDVDAISYEHVFAAPR